MYFWESAYNLWRGRGTGYMWVLKRYARTHHMRRNVSIVLYFATVACFRIQGTCTMVHLIWFTFATLKKNGSPFQIEWIIVCLQNILRIFHSNISSVALLECRIYLFPHSFWTISDNRPPFQRNRPPIKWNLSGNGLRNVKPFIFQRF